MNIESILEAAILCESEPLPINRMKRLFAEHQLPGDDELRAALDRLTAHYADRGIQLVEVKSGYRFQTDPSLTSYVQRLHEKRPPRASTAYLETLAIIAYQQPATRGEIEDIRGVAVSTQIIRSLIERDWIRVMGYRDVPGKPALYGTTKCFLDDFNLKSLKELPPLKALVNLEQMGTSVGQQLQMDMSAGINPDDSSAINALHDSPGEPGTDDARQALNEDVADVVVESIDEKALDAAYEQANALFDRCDDFMQKINPSVGDALEDNASDDSDLESESEVESET